MKRHEIGLVAVLVVTALVVEFAGWTAVNSAVPPGALRRMAGDTRPTAAGFSAAGLPAGKGQSTVATVCTACHSSAIILQQRLTRDRWDKLLTWMQKTQNLRHLEPDMRAEILDYLEEHFAPSRPLPGSPRPSQPPAADRRVMPIE